MAEDFGFEEIETETGKFRNWVFTLNNYTDNEIDILLKCTKNSGHTKIPGEHFKKGDKQPFIQYLCFSKEIAPTTGTPHLQGYMELDDGYTRSNLKKKLENKRIALFVRKAKTAEPAINYTKFEKIGEGKNKKLLKHKPNPTWVEYGKLKEQGKRNDLIDVKNKLVKFETTCDEIVLENPELYHKYGRTLEKIQSVALRKQWRQWMTEGHWYFGPTAIGKTYEAFKGFTPDTHYVLNLQDNGWWDGYKGQETVIINEFRGQIQYSELLDLIDEKAKTVKQRNRESVPFLAKKVIITSPLLPTEIYKNILSDDDKFDQIVRRIKYWTKDIQNEPWIEYDLVNKQRIIKQIEQENEQDNSQQLEQEILDLETKINNLENPRKKIKLDH